MRSKEISKENLQYINQFYQLNVTIGQRVIAIGKPGTVIGAKNGYLLIQLDSDKAKNPGNYHPTYEMVYLDQILTWVA